MRPFPVDDFTLDQVEHALWAARDVDGTLVGADFTLWQLLEFLSGYNPILLAPEDDREDVVSYPNPLYGPNDVIQALINEVRRLRGQTATTASET